jgi:TIR domain
VAEIANDFWVVGLADYIVIRVTGQSMMTEKHWSPAAVGSLVMSLPEKRRIQATPHGLRIDAVSLVEPTVTGNWARDFIPYPADCDPDTLTVYAALAHEWQVDLIVGFKTHDGFEDRVEFWRVSPARVLVRHHLRDENQTPIKPATAAFASVKLGSSSSDARFLLQHVGDREITYTICISSSGDYSVTTVDKPRQYDVFVSYKSKDSETFAKLLDDYLKRRGLNTWFSPNKRKFNFRRDIEDAIENSAHYLIIWSQHSYGSDDVRPIDPWSTGSSRNDEMTQWAEIKCVLDHTKATNRSALLLLCDYGGGPLPRELHDNQWHLHSREELGGADLKDDEYAKKLSQQITDAVNEAKAHHRR